MRSGKDIVILLILLLHPEDDGTRIGIAGLADSLDRVVIFDLEARDGNVLEQVLLLLRDRLLLGRLALAADTAGGFLDAASVLGGGALGSGGLGGRIVGARSRGAVGVEVFLVLSLDLAVAGLAGSHGQFRPGG